MKKNAQSSEMNAHEDLMIQCALENQGHMIDWRTGHKVGIKETKWFPSMYDGIREVRVTMTSGKKLWALMDGNSRLLSAFSAFL